MARDWKGTGNYLQSTFIPSDAFYVDRLFLVGDWDVSFGNRTFPGFLVDKRAF